MIEELRNDLHSTDRAGEAVAIWEKGVQKEKDGSMTDAVNFYRQALKINEKVEKIYRNILHEEWALQKQLQELKVSSNVNEGTTDAGAHVEQGLSSNIGREADNVLPCWILEMLPNDILLKIVESVILISGESWLNLSLTCTTFNELCFHNSIAFKKFAGYVYSRQTYDKISMDLNGISDLTILEEALWGSNHEKMLQDRPYVKFQGVYISIVNYLRHGSVAEGSSSLINPIHMITYYRYLRFYPNGQCLRLLTTEEPSHIVKRYTDKTPPHGSEICRWDIGFADNFGHLTIRRSSEKYSFVEELQIKSQGSRRHHKLKWLNSTVLDKEGNISECSLRNEKPFFFSRVKSYITDIE